MKCTFKNHVNDNLRYGVSFLENKYTLYENYFYSNNSHLHFMLFMIRNFAFELEFIKMLSHRIKLTTRLQKKIKGFIVTFIAIHILPCIQKQTRLSR